MSKKDYTSNVYNALRDNLEGFNKDEATFRTEIQNPEYAKKVYRALSDNLEGFKRTEEDFYTQVGLKKKDQNQPTSSGLENGSSLSLSPEKERANQNLQFAPDPNSAGKYVAPKPVGAYATMQAAHKVEQDKYAGLEGNRAGYLYNKFLEGVGQMASGVGDIIGQGMLTIADDPGGRTKQEVLKQTRKEFNPLVRESMKSVLGATVDKKLEEKYNKEFLTSSVGGLASSVPAMLGSSTTGGATFLVQAYDNALQEVEDSDLSENEKSIYAGSVGLAQAVLEKYGLDRIIKNTGVSQAVSRKLAAEALEGFAKSGEKITVKAFNEALEKAAGTLEKRAEKIGAGALFGAGIEGGTEGIQQASQIAIQEAFNKAKGKQIFDNGSWTDMIKQSLYAGAQGAVGGGLLSGVMHAPKTSVAKIVSEGGNEDFQKILDAKLEEGELTPEAHEKVVDFLHKAQNINTQIPQTVKGDARANTILTIQERGAVQDQIEGLKEQLKTTDEAFHPEIDKQIEELTLESASLNDRVQEAAFDDKYNYYTEGGKEGEGAEKYFKKFGKEGTPQPITQETYEYETNRANPQTDVEESTTNIEQSEGTQGEGEITSQTQEAVVQPEQGAEPVSGLEEGAQDTTTEDTTQPAVSELEQGVRDYAVSEEIELSDEDVSNIAKVQATSESELGEVFDVKEATDFYLKNKDEVKALIAEQELPSNGNTTTKAANNGQGATPAIPPTSANNSASQPTPTGRKSLEQTRRERLEALNQKQKEGSRIKRLWDNVMEKSFDASYKVSKFLRNQGEGLVDKYMTLRQGAPGAAIAFSEKIKNGIFGDMSFKKKIKYRDINGNEEVKSERDLLGDVITGRRVLNIDKIMKDKFARMKDLERDIAAEKAKPLAKRNMTNIADMVKERESIVNYLNDKKVLSYDAATKSYKLSEMKGEGGHNVSEYKEHLENLEKELPKELYDKLNEKAKQYNDYFANLLKMQYENGIINSDQYASLLEHEYAPRAFWEHMVSEESDKMNDTYFSKLNQGIKGLQGGSENTVYNDYEAMLDIATVGAFKRAFENDAANELAKFVKKNPNNGKVVEAEQVKNQNGTPKVDKFGNPVYKDIPRGKDTIVYYDKGIKKKLIADAEFVEVWYGKKGGISPKLAKNLRKYTLVNAIRKGATELNPAFGTLQFALLDAPHVLMNTDTYSTFLPLASAQFLADVNKVKGDLYKREGIWKEASAAGAFSDMLSREYHDPTIEKYIKRSDKNKLQRAGKAYADFVGGVNEYFETLTRLAVYNRKKADLMAAYKKEYGEEPNIHTAKGRKDLKDIQHEAAYAARETVNFSRGGTTSKDASNIFAYLNAGMQTFYTSAKYAKDHPVQFAAKVGQAAAATSALLLYSLGYWDDEKEKERKQKIYESIPEFERRNRVIIIPGTDLKRITDAVGLTDDKVQYLRILPKPPTAAPFLNQIEDKIKKEVVPDIYKKEENGLLSDVRNALPVDPSNILARQPLASAAVAYGGNYDLYKKREVTKEINKSDYLEGQDDPSVKPIYKAIARLTHDWGLGEGISPKRTQEAINKSLTDPEKNPSYSLFFTPASYLALEAFDDKELKEQFKDRLDLSGGFGTRLRGLETKERYDEQALDGQRRKEGELKWEAKKGVREAVEAGMTRNTILTVLDNAIADQMKGGLELTAEKREDLKNDFIAYYEKMQYMKKHDSPDWYAEIDRQNTNKGKAKLIYESTKSGGSIARDNVLKELENNGFITRGSSSEDNTIRFYLKQFREKKTD